MHRVLLAEHGRDPSLAARDELLLQKPLGILDAALKGRDHLAGNTFSVADLNVAAILSWAKIARLDFSAQPNVARWLDACLARPASMRVRAMGRKA
jgi:glutathione S-transferase